MDKYTCCPEIKAPDGTDFNDPPVGLRRIDEKEFAKSRFFSHTPEFVEHRQIHVKSSDDLTRGNGKVICIIMWWFDDATGIAMSNDYWGGKVEYFTFGCQHEYHELSRSECISHDIYHAGLCFHVLECSKCHNITSYDSSD